MRPNQRLSTPPRAQHPSERGFHHRTVHLSHNLYTAAARARFDLPPFSHSRTRSTHRSRAVHPAVCMHSLRVPQNLLRQRTDIYHDIAMPNQQKQAPAPLQLQTKRSGVRFKPLHASTRRHCAYSRRRLGACAPTRMHMHHPRSSLAYGRPSVHGACTRADAHYPVIAWGQRTAGRISSAAHVPRSSGGVIAPSASLQAPPRRSTARTRRYLRRARMYSARRSGQQAESVIASKRDLKFNTVPLPTNKSAR